MNYAVILSGGVGSRMKGLDRPKQYVEVAGKPILSYTLKTVDENPHVDRIVIVADPYWRDYITEANRKFGVTKFFAFADPGESRQESVFNGLKACVPSERAEEDAVIVHDGVRPLAGSDIIDRCLAELENHDGAMPVIPMNDTVYYSEDGRSLTKLLNRDKLFAGQAPEAFKLQKYLKINGALDKKGFASVRGSSEIAFKSGLDVSLIEGDPSNFKITTISDLERFRLIAEGNLQ